MFFAALGLLLLCPGLCYCHYMTTTGTYAFNPPLGELVLNAYARIGVRQTSILASHMADARIEANLLQAEWNNKQVNLWTVDLIEEALVQGVGEIDVDDNTVMILDAYISVEDIDTMIFPISRTEWAALPDKLQEGRPTQFWFDRLEDSVLQLWPVPDDNGPYVLKYYRCKLIQDAALRDGANVQIPQLWLDAFAAGLAYRLARIYAPQLRESLKMDYKEAWEVAAAQNTENVPMFIAPGLSGYFR